MIIGLSVLVLVTCAYGIAYSSALTSARRAVARVFKWAPGGSASLSAADTKGSTTARAGSDRKTGRDEEQLSGDAGAPVLSVPSFTFSTTEIDTPDTTPKALPIHGDDAEIPSIQLSAPMIKPPTPPMDDDDDNYVPSFPALNSAQRASSGSSGPSAPSLMLPPPLPNRNPSLTPSRRPNPSQFAGNLAPAAVQRGPPRRNTPQNPNSLRTPPTITEKPKKPRKKIILEPGHSPLDWARLQRSGIDLRGVSSPGPLKITPSELKRHCNSPHDVWMALDGKVYNVSAYLPFHPGGEREVLRGAGKDATALFMQVHPWVNVTGMLGECLIGYLVPEEEGSAVPSIETEVEVQIVGSLEDID